MAAGSSGPEPTAQSHQASTLLSAIVDEAYHPLALRHLPQPKPSDCPSGYDASIFTFQDAFEDLLAVTAGRELMPIDMKHSLRTLLDLMYPRGEPDSLWHLRLQKQGLIPDGRVPQFTRGSSMEPDGELSQLLSHVDRVAGKVWKMAREQLDKEGLTFWGMDKVDTANESLVKETGRGWDNVNTTVKSLFGGDDSANGKRAEPRHFDDLFSAVESDVADRDRSWDTFMKSFTEGSKRKETSDEKGPKKVTETHEHTGRFGWRHCKETTSILDPEGNEIGKETLWTITSRDHDPEGPALLGPHDREKENSYRPRPQPSAKLAATDGGTRDVETRNKYVDRFGYLHTTTESKTLDRDGNEISRSTYINIRPAKQANKDLPRPSRGNEGDQTRRDGENVYSDHRTVRKQGWFWK